MRHYIAYIILLCSSYVILGHVHFSRNHYEKIKGRKSEKFSEPVSQVTPDCDDCPHDGVCVPKIQCPVVYHHKTNITECHTGSGRLGVCCKPNHDSANKVVKTARSIIPKDLMDDMSEYSGREFKNLMDIEFQASCEREAGIESGTVSYTHYRNFRIPQESIAKVIKLNHDALELAQASKWINNRRNIILNDVNSEQFDFDLNQSPLATKCLEPIICSNPSDPYRTIDGSCNNKENTRWGSAMTAYTRIVPALYDDGVWNPRVSVTHRPLPSARLVSSTLISDVDKPHSGRTLLMMQFGQFLTHDILRSMIAIYENGTGVNCCTEDGKEELPFVSRHYACMPIHMPFDDPFFSYFQQGCMNFVRSVLAPPNNCEFGAAQQMNLVSHYLDGSSIYGSDIPTMEKLREFNGGLLKIFNDFNRTLLPLSKQPNDCFLMDKNAGCFSAGDNRVNQIITLTAIHTMFIREHNHIAKELWNLNPHWNDDKLYFETRRIVGAMLQHIVYNDWLPLLIGDDDVADFKIKLNPHGYSSDYDPRLDPSIINEFATAAFRLHTLVDGKLAVFGKDHLEEVISIPEVQFNPTRLRRRDFFDEIMITLTSQPMQQFDMSFADGMTKLLFRTVNPFGIDIAAFNIQRGRDHGLRTYNEYRELLGLPKVIDFDEYKPEFAEKLKKLYESPDDIDLWIGGILEPPEKNAIVGITFKDIIANQFSKLRRGDRYFYDFNPDINPGYFTLEQLLEIKKTTIARIICDNSDKILIVRQTLNPFIMPDTERNRYVDCDSPEIPKLNLELWKDKI